MRSSQHARSANADVERYALQPGESLESRDDRLLEGLRSGDAAALEATFVAYYDGLYRHAFRFTSSREIAEELIQDVFLRIWERRHQLVGSERLQPLLFASARNAAISWLRRERLERRYAETGVPGLSQFSTDIADPIAQNEQQELVQVIRDAVEMLPPRARMAITLRWQQKLKNAEIAQVMGVSVKAVEFSIARALNHLRKALEPER